MPFSNPITGEQGTLIRAQIKSPNFNETLKQGWAILKNGQAFLYQLTVGQVIAEALYFPETAFYAPSGDTSGNSDTAVINTLLADGYRVILTGGLYWINATLLIPSRGMLAGIGGCSVVLQATSSFTGAYMIELANPATTYQATIKDLILFCGTGSATLTGPGGIQLDNTGWTNPGGTGNNNVVDSQHTVTDVWIMNAGGDGLHLDNHVREARITRVHVYICAGYGIYEGDASGAGSGCTDSHFTDCTVGFAQQHGWLALSSNNKHTGCKGFASGNNFYNGSIGTTQCGMEMSGPNCLSTTVTGGDFQQNALHGIDMQSISNCSVTGNSCDSNGAGTGTTGAGINIFDSPDCVVTGNSGKQFLTPGNQQYGIIHQGGTSSRTWIGPNSVTGTLDTFGYTAGSGYYLIDGPTTTDFSNVNEFRAGAPELYDRGITTTLATNGVITVVSTQGTYAIDSTGNVTGLTFTAWPHSGGAVIIVVNTGTFSMAFPAGANLATGFTLGANGTQLLVWISATSLWYPVN